MAGATPRSPLIAPPSRPSLDDARLQDGFTLRVTGTNSQSFIIQTSTNLVDWTNVYIDTLFGSSADYLDSNTAHFPQRFYRALPLEALFARPGLRVVPGIGIGAGAFPVRVLGSGGQPFLLQTSTDLQTWLELSQGLIIGDYFDFFDSEAINFPNRFYRAVPFR